VLLLEQNRGGKQSDSVWENLPHALMSSPGVIGIFEAFVILQSLVQFPA
jgi:hypothetical protein